MIIYIFKAGQKPIFIQAINEQDATKQLDGYGYPFPSLSDFSEFAHKHLLFPSGVYADEDKASEAISALAGEQHAKLISTYINDTGWTQMQLSNAIGFVNPRNDGSHIRKLLSCKSRLAGPSLRQVAQLIAGRVLETKEEETEVLTQYKGGAWRDVKWSQVRSKDWKLS